MITMNERPLLGQSDGQRGDTATIRSILESDIVPDRSVAIDGGAHVGSWTVFLAGAFDRVIAFEPCQESFAMLQKNMARYKNVECKNQALMDAAGKVDVTTPSKKQLKLTSRIVRKSKTGGIRCVKIDSLKLETCGLIKLDVEGAEGMAIKGASETLKRCRPTLVVEIWGQSVRWGHSAIEVHQSIEALGYVYARRFGVDHVYIPRAE